MAEEGRHFYEHLGGISAGIAIVGFIAGGAYYMAGLQNQLDNAKLEITELRAKLEAEASRLQKGDKGEKGDKGDKGDAGPPGEKGRDGQTADNSRLDQLSQQIVELNRRVTGLPQAVAAVPVQSPLAAASGHSPTSGAAGPNTLIGRWVGAVNCPASHFVIAFTVKTQTGRTASGSWEWSGSTRGSTDATLSPNPSADKPDDYALVPATSSAYSYTARVTPDEIVGESTRGNCNLHLEKGE